MSLFLRFSNSMKILTFTRTKSENENRKNHIREKSTFATLALAFPRKRIDFSRFKFIVKYNLFLVYTYINTYLFSQDEPVVVVVGEVDKKDDSGNETGADVPEVDDDPYTGYDKTKSFFDNISCEAIERSVQNCLLHIPFHSCKKRPLQQRVVWMS